MENVNHLKDLLRYTAQHLYSSEEQIMEAMPAMIDKASNPQLKQALEQHARLTDQQLNRLTQVMNHLGENMDRGIFASLFATGQKSLAVEGLISEGQKLMSVDMDPDVMDAAIIGCVQKIEHYEISAYGTARSFAEQLGLTDVAQLLQQTLLEEHDADDLLTSLAVQEVNKKAEAGTGA
ncbi:MAG TPA: ferritin-like domain-containing protein [Flavisolibacter sp.]|nr:ferritin-like domain-containing protein [Flavisolibacter sp.]